MRDVEMKGVMRLQIAGLFAWLILSAGAGGARTAADMEYAELGWGKVSPTVGSKLVPKELWIDKAEAQALTERLDAEWKALGYVRKGTIHPGHSFTKWTQDPKYWDQHRDWFGLTPNGVRGAVMPIYPPWIRRLSKMCVSNEEVVDARIAEWVKAGKPQCLRCGENDGSLDFCRCEKCRALDADLPGEPFLSTKTDRYLNFWNRVAAKARKLRPDVKVAVHLYSRYYEPPRRERVEYPDNMRFSFVAKFMDGDPAATIRAWQQAGMKEFFFRPNYHCNRSVFPIGREKYIWEIHRQLWELGSLGDNFDSSPGVAATGFERYTALRLCVDPNVSFEEIERDWCARFGAAAATVKTYFARVRARCDREWLKLLAFLRSERAEFLDDSHFSLYYHRLHTVAELEADARVLDEFDDSVLSGEEQRRFTELKLCARHYVLTRRALATRTEADKQALRDYRYAHRSALSLNWTTHYRRTEWLLTDPTPARIALSNFGIVRFVEEVENAAMNPKNEKAFVQAYNEHSRTFLEKSRLDDFILEKEEGPKRFRIGESELGFRIGFEGAAGEKFDLASEDMRSFVCTPEGDVRHLVWKGQALCGGEFTVAADLKVTGDAVEYGNFRYEGNHSGRKVTSVVFPECRVPRTDSTRLLRPFCVGVVFRPKWKIPTGDALLSSGSPTSFRFLAALNDRGESYYLDQRDESRFFSGDYEYVNVGGKRQVALRFRHDVPLSEANSRAYRLPYGGVFTRFRGDWYEAAQIYRKWVSTQPHYRQALARDRGRLRDVGLWMWSRGRSKDILPDIERIRRETGVPIALDWYWWHNNPYDTQYPFFWPPRENLDEFRAAVKGLREKGVWVQPYTNGTAWDCDDPSWKEKGGSEGAIIRNGDIVAHEYNKFAHHRLARMCGEAPRFQAIMEELAGHIAASGFDSLYLDQINCLGFGTCFNPKHRHECGGGDHMIRNYRAFVDRIRAAHPGMQLSTEEFHESYLDTFDSVICVHSGYERYGTKAPTAYVPVVPAVFHRCQTMYGSFATVGGLLPWDEFWPASERWPASEELPWEQLYPDHFAIELCRGVTWGVQPMVHNFKAAYADDPRYAADCKLLFDTARFYHANRDFLFDGELLNPGKLECPTQKALFLKRKTFTPRGQQKTIEEPALPRVFHSVWRAPDGRIAAVLVNWSREDADCRLETPDITFAGTVPARSWRRVDANAGAMARDFDVRAYGAKGDGTTLDTVSLQAAIDACAAAGGGRVVLEGGRFLSGTITLKSGVDLHLDKSATLLGSRNCADYPERTDLRHVISANLPRERNACFIWAEEAHDISISGGGVIDCQGDAFVRKATAADANAWAPFVRIPGLPTPPRVVFFAGCRDVRLTDFTMVNQPAGWSFWLTDCDRVWCDRLRIDADLRFPNNDGIHVNCSRDVFISNCFISTCDDAIVVRANSRALKENRPCERVHVANCSLRSGCACIRIGYLNDGAVRDCVFSNLTMNRSQMGVRMELPPFKVKPDRGREATLVENLAFANIEMREVRYPIHFLIAETPETRCEAVRDLRFSGVCATGGERLVLRGRAANPLERLTFSDCAFRTAAAPELCHCKGLVGL